MAKSKKRIKGNISKKCQGSGKEFDLLMFSKPCPACGTVQLCHEKQTVEEATKDFFARHDDKSCKEGMEADRQFKLQEGKPCSVCGAPGGGYHCDCMWVATSDKGVEFMPRDRSPKTHKKSRNKKNKKKSV